MKDRYLVLKKIFYKYTKWKNTPVDEYHSRQKHFYIKKLIFSWRLDGKHYIVSLMLVLRETKTETGLSFYSVEGNNVRFRGRLVYSQKFKAFGLSMETANDTINLSENDILVGNIFYRVRTRYEIKRKPAA